MERDLAEALVAAGASPLPNGKLRVPRGLRSRVLACPDREALTRAVAALLALREARAEQERRSDDALREQIESSARRNARDSQRAYLANLAARGHAAVERAAAAGRLTAAEAREALEMIR